MQFLDSKPAILMLIHHTTEMCDRITAVNRDSTVIVNYLLHPDEGLLPCNEESLWSNLLSWLISWIPYVSICIR